MESTAVDGRSAACAGIRRRARSAHARPQEPGGTRMTGSARSPGPVPTSSTPIAGTVGSLGRLDPAERATALRRLADETFDVLVIGGGVTGAGAALDAASRGL